VVEEEASDETVGEQPQSTAYSKAKTPRRHWPSGRGPCERRPHLTKCLAVAV